MADVDPAAAGRVASGGSTGDWEVLDGLQADEELLLFVELLAKRDKIQAQVDGWHAGGRVRGDV